MTIEETLRTYTAALLQGDRRAAVDVVQQAQATGHDFRTLYLRVLQPALEEVGRLWQINAIGVADEHLATAITQFAMVGLYQRISHTPRSKTRTFIGACAASERHDLGLRMVCDFLDVEGWQTWYLGSSVPVDSLVSFVRAYQPETVGLSASLTTHIFELKEVIIKLRELPKPPFVLVGGRACRLDPTVAHAIGADACARDAAEAVAVLEERFPDPGMKRPAHLS